ncbi:hypothetical protein [Paraburkholderia caribensis]|uniref:hypothetical protein n=1 Tax=Paraburkholderia caribensis TaxID=75105 RepID=UPI00078B2B19|nr:hypothetical protein [Paraburkholderia caribensis]AMV42267.1 hypothetical protein ATN79_06190 [Paraburkholderia caribensis]
MTEKLTQEQQSTLGNQAKIVLENPAFQEALKRLNQRFYDEWSKTDPGDVATRERLFAHVQVQRSLFNCLNSILGDGQISNAVMASAKGKNR